MKTRLLLAACMVAATTCFSQAQNIQLHYDFGRSLYEKDLPDRPVLTTTVEYNHPDSWGNTYFFVDMYYKEQGVSTAYWEIFRELKFWKNPFSVHLEYNGGLSKAASIKNAWLLGVTYTKRSSSGKRWFTFTPMYKYIQKHSSPHNFQLTAAWHVDMLDGVYTFNGFIDWWREKSSYGTMVFLSEPQFWINFDKIDGINKKLRLSFGSELKVCTNLVDEGFYVIPTLALKWRFR